jgi:hypothetical protein
MLQAEYKVSSTNSAHHIIRASTFVLLRFFWVYLTITGGIHIHKHVLSFTLSFHPSSYLNDGVSSNQIFQSTNADTVGPLSALYH